MKVEMYIACTYFDLPLSNLNITQMIWGNFSHLEDAIKYVKSIRRRKSDTLFGAWDIYDESGDFPKGGWSYNKIVKHFPPRKNHDFFGNPIKHLKIAIVEAIT